MSFVILVRNPSTGGVFLVTDHENPDHAAVWETEELAQVAAQTVPVCRRGLTKLSRPRK
jgi:hypothetical protein